MKKAKSLIGIFIAVLLIILLVNPQWIMPQKTAQAIRDLEHQYLLIQRSGRITFAHIVTLLVSVCIVWLIYTLLKSLLTLVSDRSERSKTVTSMLIGMLKYIAVIAAVVWGLSILGVNTTAVLAGVGILGLVLGFGAQSLIEDIITGIFIIFEGQYDIGDIIILDDFRGIVRNIGVRTTVIEDAGGNLKIVNNSDIRNLQNRSRILSLAVCDVDVSYDTNLDKLEKMLNEELPKLHHRDLYVTAPYYKGVEALGASGVTIRIVADVKEVNIFPAKRRLNQDVRMLLHNKGVEIPFPQVVVHNGDA
jgi:small conductance mechanosensitive channel